MKTVGRDTNLAKLLFLALSLLLLLTGCQTARSGAPLVPNGADAGELVGWEACDYHPADNKKARIAAECGTLVVPEDWQKAGSRLIGLPVVRVPASGPDPAEPVFYLQGGPGQSNLSWEPPAWLLEKHDVIFVGYRGVDGDPTLACPEVTRRWKAHVGKDAFSDRAREAYADAVQQCAARHQAAGVDLSGYTIPNVIEDLEAARDALGYPTINLLSESYGTRVAQIYAYMHPDSLHRLVLIGVNTPGHFLWDRTALDAMIARISDLCAQDAACSRRTDNLAQTIFDVNHSMPERWLFFKIDPDTVRLGAHFMLLDNPSMAMILDAYLAAAEGDPSGLAMLNLATTLAPIDRQIFGDLAGKAGTADIAMYSGLESVSLGDSILGAPMAEFIWPMAEVWPLEWIPEELRQFQESDVEMLLVNGTLDFSTPPTALEEARPYYHRAQMVLLPELGHVTDVMATFQPQAFERLVTRYYNSGEADSSLYVYQPLPFEPGMRLTVTARLLLAAMIVLPLLIVVGAVAVVRRIRRRSARN